MIDKCVCGQAGEHIHFHMAEVWWSYAPTDYDYGFLFRRSVIGDKEYWLQQTDDTIVILVMAHKELLEKLGTRVPTTMHGVEEDRKSA